MSLQHSTQAWLRTLLGSGALALVILVNGATFSGGTHAAKNKDHTTDRLLKEVVPGADSFSEKEGEVPVYKAYKTDPDSGEKTLIGYAFVTADTHPEPSGYSAEIDTLIGMDLDGYITGLKVIYYKESLRYTWGDFFAWDGYEEQFIGKRAEHRFQIGNDIDGIVKATISAKAMARGVRQSIRAVTLEYLR
jgi:NosR/NirI family transcriptional regulator, nitrous oxide reductase regulator